MTRFFERQLGSLPVVFDDAFTYSDPERVKLSDSEVTVTSSIFCKKFGYNL